MPSSPEADRDPILEALERRTRGALRISNSPFSGLVGEYSTDYDQEYEEQFDHDQPSRFSPSRDERTRTVSATFQILGTLDIQPKAIGDAGKAAIASLTCRVEKYDRDAGRRRVMDVVVEAMCFGTSLETLRRADAGDLISITGHIDSRPWSTQNGHGHNVQLVADQLTFPMKGSQPEDNSWGGQQENHGYSGRPNSQGWGSEGGRSSGNQGSHGGWGNSDSGNRNPGEDDDIPF